MKTTGIKSIFGVAITAMLLSMVFSCGSDTSTDTPLPSVTNSSGLVSTLPSSSSVAVHEYGYCIYPEYSLCLIGTYQACPSGGILSEYCPFASSNSSQVSSSSAGASSSSEVSASSSSSQASSSGTEVPSSSSHISISSSSNQASSSSVTQQFGYCVFATEKVCLETWNGCPLPNTYFEYWCPYSSVPSSSSSSSSSSIITYTPTCTGLPSTGTAGIAITQPSVKCIGSNGLSVAVTDVVMQGSPIWNNPTAGTYTVLAVLVGGGICGGQVVSCGTLTISALSSSSKASSSSSAPSSSSIVSSSSMASSSSLTPSSSSTGCRAAHNTSTQYCSNGTMKTYGSVTDQGGQTYKTVVIGTQTWMAQNLNYNASGSKCYKNSEANCTTYGRLYDWVTAMKLPTTCNNNTCATQVQSKHQGICPDGWHIPSDADWNVLMKVANPSCSDNSDCADAGRKLKATSGWNEYVKGTDDFGFAALPGGFGYSVGSFYSAGIYGRWWSASEGSSLNANNTDMNHVGDEVRWFGSDKGSLFSVRCLQD